MEKIEFASQGTTCRGVFLKAPTAGTERRPCIVMAHGFSLRVADGIMPFAVEFQRAGNHCLLFDYRGFGASDGDSPLDVSPHRQLADYRAAIAYARQRPEVDPLRIIVWGTSFAGGHAFTLAATEPGLYAAIAQCPMLDGWDATINYFKYAGIRRLLGLVALGIRDAISGVFGTRPAFVVAAGAPGALAFMATPDSPSLVAIAAGDWPNQARARIALHAWAYRPISKAKSIKCATLAIICEDDRLAPAATAWKAVKRAAGSVVGVGLKLGHFDVYQGEGRAQSIAAQLEFLEKL